MEIQELRPAEEAHMLDPDRESEREKREMEERNRQNITKSTKKDDDEPPTSSSKHLIDIKV